MEASNEISDNSVAIVEESQNEPGEQQRLQPEGSSMLWSCCSSGEGAALSDGVVRAIFLLLGVGILIPWNAFVSAKPYFTARFCESGQDIVNFEQWFGLAWNFSSVCSLGLIIIGQCKFLHLWSKKAHEFQTTYISHVRKAFSEYCKRKREQALVASDDRSNGSSSNGGNSGSTKDNSFYNVMVPLGLYTIVFSIQALLVTIPDISPTRFLVITLIGLALCGTCGAIATAGIVSTAGRFPSHIGINPFFSGQALGGAAVSIANFIAIAVGEDPNDFIQEHCAAANHTQSLVLEIDPMVWSTSSRRRLDDVNRLLEESHDCSPYQGMDWAVLSYFLFGCIVLLLCLWGYQKIHQFQNMGHRDNYETVRDVADNARYPDDIDECSPRIGLELNDRIHQRQQAQYSDNENLIASHEMPQVTEEEENDNPMIQTDAFEDEDEQNIVDEHTSQSIFSAIKGPAFCIFMTFTITLSLFPSWISELKSNHECENRFRLDNDLYIPFSFVFFNIGDLLGRLMSGYIPVDQIRDLPRKLAVCAILRIAFLPLFLMCNTTIAGDSSMVIRNDFFSLLVQLLFAVSNGLLVSTAFMVSPQLVGSSPTTQERASEIMTFSVFFGLLSGSFFAFPFLQFATRMLQ